VLQRKLSNNSHKDFMNINIITSAKNWMESSAIDQFEKTAKLPGMIAAAGMPDLHPGKDAPIGAVFATDTVVYPHLVGTDIGCGMSFWQTELSVGKVKVDKLVKRLQGLEDPWRRDLGSLLQQSNIEPTSFDSSLGTIGGGNHFAELQQCHTVYEPGFFRSSNIDDTAIFLLVHSGSRGFGEHVLREYQANHSNRGQQVDSDAGIRYLAAHDQALRWAVLNRKLIAARFLEAIGTNGNQLLDICHNSVTKEFLNRSSCFMHRKGAAPSDRGPIVIPGSRGALSYLVESTGSQDLNLSTLAHGAGRKWKRSECKGRLSKKFAKEDLIQTNLGSRVICEDKELLYEEAPQAYKNIEVVVDSLVAAKLIKILATFSPLVTYKTRKGVVA
jgi:release factor H-coupled RctB family protein